jgi:hypothetical protein
MTTTTQDAIENDDPLNPNAYVKKDPKPLLLLLEDYATKNNMKSKHKKNSHKIEFFFPL